MVSQNASESFGHLCHVVRRDPQMNCFFSHKFTPSPVLYTSFPKTQYRTGPGQHIVGSALVSVQGMPPHVWPSETHALHLAAGK